MSSFNDTQRSSIGSHDRKLKYRLLIEDLSALDDDNENDVELFVNRTSSVVKGAKDLFHEGGVEDRVKHPGESLLDSKVLRAASDLAVRCSVAVSGNVNTYDKHELALNIRENSDFWSFSFPSEVPAAAYLYGTFAPTPPEQRPRAPRKHVQRQQAAALKAPENVDRLQRVEEVPQMVNRVNRYIKKKYEQTGRPLSYFHTVLDPNSFSGTIENIFYISFLVQDALISVTLDEENGLPFITPVPRSPHEQADPAEKNQFIVSMDRKRWKELVEAFRITTPMLTLKR